MKKRGPKGPSKIRGQVLETITKEHEDNPSNSSEWLAQRVLEKTGVQLTSRAIRYTLRRLKRGRSFVPFRREMQYQQPILALHS